MEKFIQMDKGSGQTVITANGFVYAPKGGRANFLPASKGQFFALWRATLIPVPESKFFPYPRTNFLPVPQDKPFFFGKGELSFHPHWKKISIHHAPPPQSGAKHLHRGGGHLDVGGGGVGWPLEEGQMFLLFRGETEQKDSWVCPRKSGEGVDATLRTHGCNKIRYNPKQISPVAH